MAGDLAVRFSGDTSKLTAAISQAKQALASFAPATSGQAKIALDLLAATMAANADASDKASASWRDNINVLASLTTIARGAVDGIRAVGTAAIAGAAATAGAINTVDRSLDAAFSHATDGLGNYIATLQHGSGEARSFLHDQEGMFSGIGRMVTAAQTSIKSLELSFTGLARAELNAIMATGNGQAFVDTVGLANVKQRLDDFTASLMQIPGISKEAAGGIEVMLATVPGYTEAANAGLIALIATISANGDEAVANATKISTALKDPTAAGGATIATMVGSLADKLKASEGNAAQFKAQLGDINTLTEFFAHSLQPASASAYFDAILAKLKAQNLESKTNMDANEAALKTYGALSGTLLKLQEADVANARLANAEREEAIALLQGMLSVSNQINAVQARQTTFTETLDKSNPVNAQIDAVQSKISILQGQLNVGTSKTPALTPQDIETLVRTVIGEAGNQSAQGQLAVAAVALNRLANGNFGDSLTKILKAGDGSQFNTFKPLDKGGSQTDQANAPTPVDSYRYQQVLHDIVQPLLDKKVADPTNGALNFYNPALTAPQNQFGMTGTTTIGDHRFGTAKNSPAAIEPMDPDTLAQTKQALADLQDKLAQLNATKAGGTEVDRAQLVIAQQKAAGVHDEVAAAQLLLDAHKKDAATAQAGTPGKQRTADAGVAEAQAALSEKEAEVAKANLEKQIAATETGSQEWLRITLQKYDLEEARAKGNAAEITRLETQKLEAAKTANKQSAADAAATETATYANKKRGLDDQLAAMKANESEGSLSAYAVLQQTKAIQDQETALEKTHLENLARIWQGIPAEYRKVQEQLAQLDAKRVSEGLRTNQQFEESVVSTYRQAMQEVASTVSSSLMAIIQKTGTIRDLLRNVALNIVQQFMNAGLKLVADWVVNQTKTVAVTVASQAAQTSAVASGTAAQTGLIGTSSIAQAASVAMGAVKAIGAYAAQAAAGVTAFMSAIIGPAALGVGAGMAAAVTALGATIPSFEVGAWQLPSAGLAMLHQNEMVVPAGPAQAFRDAMSGGGGGGGVTHHNYYGDTNYTISGQRHPTAVVDEIKHNQRAIGRMLATQRKP